MACLNITGAMRTTPTGAMEAIIGLTPLDLHVKEVALMALVRLRTVGVNPEVGAGQLRLRLWREALTVLPLLQASIDAIEPRYVFNKPYRIKTKLKTE